MKRYLIVYLTEDGDWTTHIVYSSTIYLALDIFESETRAQGVKVQEVYSIAIAR